MIDVLLSVSEPVTPSYLAVYLVLSVSTAVILLGFSLQLLIEWRLRRVRKQYEKEYIIRTNRWNRVATRPRAHSADRPSSDSSNGRPHSSSIELTTKRSARVPDSDSPRSLPNLRSPLPPAQLVAQATTTGLQRKSFTNSVKSTESGNAHSLRILPSDKSQQPPPRLQSLVSRLPISVIAIKADDDTPASATSSHSPNSGRTRRDNPHSAEVSRTRTPIVSKAQTYISIGADAISMCRDKQYLDSLASIYANVGGGDSNESPRDSDASSFKDSPRDGSVDFHMTPFPPTVATLPNTPGGDRITPGYSAHTPGGDHVTPGMRETPRGSSRVTPRGPFAHLQRTPREDDDEVSSQEADDEQDTEDMAAVNDYDESNVEHSDDEPEEIRRPMPGRRMNAQLLLDMLQGRSEDGQNKQTEHPEQQLQQQLQQQEQQERFAFPIALPSEANQKSSSSELQSPQENQPLLGAGPSQSQQSLQLQPSQHQQQLQPPQQSAPPSLSNSLSGISPQPHQGSISQSANASGAPFSRVYVTIEERDERGSSTSSQSPKWFSFARNQTPTASFGSEAEVNAPYLRTRPPPDSPANASSDGSLGVPSPQQVYQTSPGKLGVIRDITPSSSDTSVIVPLPVPIPSANLAIPAPKSGSPRGPRQSRDLGMIATQPPRIAYDPPPKVSAYLQALHIGGFIAALFQAQRMVDPFSLLGYLPFSLIRIDQSVVTFLLYTMACITAYDIIRIRHQSSLRPVPTFLKIALIVCDVSTGIVITISTVFTILSQSQWANGLGIAWLALADATLTIMFDFFILQLVEDIESAKPAVKLPGSKSPTAASSPASQPRRLAAPPHSDSASTIQHVSTQSTFTSVASSPNVSSRELLGIATPGRGSLLYGGQTLQEQLQPPRPLHQPLTITVTDSNGKASPSPQQTPYKLRAPVGLGVAVRKLKIIAVVVTMIVIPGVFVQLYYGTMQFLSGDSAMRQYDATDVSSVSDALAVIILQNAIALIALWYSAIPAHFLWKDFFSSLSILIPPSPSIPSS